MQFLIIMVLMLGVMYVLMIRPQRQRQAQQQSMIDGTWVAVRRTGGTGTISGRRRRHRRRDREWRHRAHDASWDRGSSSPDDEEDDDIVEGEVDEVEALKDRPDEAAVTDGEEPSGLPQATRRRERPPLT